jgi:hypothetical protein
MKIVTRVAAVPTTKGQIASTLSRETSIPSSAAERHRKLRDDRIAIEES